MPGAAPKPISDAEVEATVEYKVLMQFSTPKGIKVSVGKSYWPDLNDLPDVIFGVIDQWVNKKELKVRITWTEPNGDERYDVEDLHILLLPHCELQLRLLATSVLELLLVAPLVHAVEVAEALDHVLLVLAAHPVSNTYLLLTASATLTVRRWDQPRRLALIDVNMRSTQARVAPLPTRLG